jgi:hypothetical protein
MMDEQSWAIAAYLRAQPAGQIEIKDADLLEWMRVRTPHSNEEAGPVYRDLQAEQVMRDAKRAGFV